MCSLLFLFAFVVDVVGGGVLMSLSVFVDLLLGLLFVFAAGVVCVCSWFSWWWYVDGVVRVSCWRCCAGSPLLLCVLLLMPVVVFVC